MTKATAKELEPPKMNQCVRLDAYVNGFSINTKGTNVPVRS